jgi:hypothetical protein
MSICILMAIFLGFLCAYGAWAITPEFHENAKYWGSWIMWSTVMNRFLLGVIVALCGVFTRGPFGFRVYPWVRGALVGFFISVDLAVWAMIEGGDTLLFWGIVFSGIISGILIDIVSTIVAGEGYCLLATLGKKEK